MLSSINREKNLIHVNRMKKAYDPSIWGKKGERTIGWVGRNVRRKRGKKRK
jgi:hypothetical protein